MAAIESRTVSLGVLLCLLHGGCSLRKLELTYFVLFSQFLCFWFPLLCDNFLIFLIEVKFWWLLHFWPTTRDSQRPCCLFMLKVLLKFALSVLRWFRDFDSLCHVGLCGLHSAIGLDKLDRREVLMINFIILRLEIRDSQTPCYLFSPLFHKRFFSQVASLFLLPLPLPSSLPLCSASPSLWREEICSFCTSSRERERASEEFYTSAPFPLITFSVVGVASWFVLCFFFFRHSHRRHGDGPQDSPGYLACAALAGSANPCS